MNAKLKRRYQLLLDALSVCARVGCQYGMCNGPSAPIRYMKTCARCATIYRAHRMGITDKNGYPFEETRTSAGKGKPKEMKN